MATIFSKIISREVPAHIVAEDDKHIAFMDVNPLVVGHVLVVPKIEVDYIFDLDDLALCDLMVFAKGVSIALRDSVDCIRIGLTVIGLEVPHTHIHLIPMSHVKDMNFAKSKLTLSNEELKATAELIRKNYLR